MTTVLDRVRARRFFSEAAPEAEWHLLNGQPPVTRCGMRVAPICWLGVRMCAPHPRRNQPLAAARCDVSAVALDVRVEGVDPQ